MGFTGKNALDLRVFYRDRGCLSPFPIREDVNALLVTCAANIADIVGDCRPVSHPSLFVDNALALKKLGHSRFCGKGEASKRFSPTVCIVS